MSRNKYPAKKSCPYCGGVLHAGESGYECYCRESHKVSFGGIINQPVETVKDLRRNPPKKGKR